MFIDRAVVNVQAGTGGSGASSFARFKYKPKGGPDGGDGGRGGSIYVRGDANLATLLDYRYRTTWKAQRGEHGKGKTQTGASAADVYMPVPPGTVVTDADTGAFIGEVLVPGDVVRVARGGRGGRGNARFATPTHQAPREWEPGEEGEERRIELVLKLIAGIIEGAHGGRGLGLKFLQHVERTRVLAFLVPLDADDPQATYERLRNEVRLYSEPLAGKPHVVVLSKRDLLPETTRLPEVSAPDAAAVLAVSSASGQGVEDLTEFLWRFVAEAREQEQAAAGSEYGREPDADEAAYELEYDEPGSAEAGNDDANSGGMA